MSNENYHIPVLLKESVDGLNIDPQGIYIDVTFGGGGHSREIMSRLKNGGTLMSFDQDRDAIANIIDDKRFIFVNHNFRYIKNFARYYNLNQVDGILADLGVSSHHFNADRGFAFRFEGELDMRMNQEAKFTAKDVINEYSPDRLRKIFREYGEIKNANKVVNLIVKQRSEKPITQVGELLEIVDGCVPKNNVNKFCAKLFQAIRIEVNQEMEALAEFLQQTTDLLKPGGRLVIITYHSLEDRMVKKFMKSGNLEGKVETDIYGNSNVPFKTITKKIIIPDEFELKENTRSRSAKLRIVEKI